MYNVLGSYTRLDTAIYNSGSIQKSSQENRDNSPTKPSILEKIAKVFRNFSQKKQEFGAEVGGRTYY